VVDAGPQAAQPRAHEGRFDDRANRVGRGLLLLQRGGAGRDRAEEVVRAGGIGTPRFVVRGGTLDAHQRAADAFNLRGVSVAGRVGSVWLQVAVQANRIGRVVAEEDRIGDVLPRAGIAVGHLAL